MTQHPQPSSDESTRGVVRPLLWFVLVVSAAFNVVLNSSDAHLIYGAGVGLVTLACIVALVVHHYRNRQP